MEQLNHWNKLYIFWKSLIQFLDLMVNTDQTQIVWTGKKKCCEEKLVCNNHIWKAIEELKLLGIHFSVELSNCLDLNYFEKHTHTQYKVLTNGTNGTALGKVKKRALRHRAECILCKIGQEKGQ